MSVPQTVLDLATACRASVLATVGVELDFEPETLPILDHYAKNHRELAAGEKVRPGKRKKSAADPADQGKKSAADPADQGKKSASGKAESDELLGLVAPICGAYFGEVLRHRFDAMRWNAPDDDHGLWRLEAESVFLFFNPIGTAVEVIEEKDAPGWGAHLRVRPTDREAVRSALELFGDVRDTDYYSFTVRFEVFEQVMETLGRQARERNERRFWESAEYDAFVARENAD
jgi:hypothetical protein